MRTAPVTQAEAEAWIAVLMRYGHLHHAAPGPNGAWTVRRTPTGTPHTLHHPVLVLDYVAEVLRDVRRNTAGTPR